MADNKNLASIFLFFSSLLISIVVADIVFGFVFDVSPTYNYRTLSDRFMRYSYTPRNDRYGFREELLPDDISAKRYKRILLLGDSFTHGHGVANGSDRFSDIVEKRLNEDPDMPANGNDYHIYNAGVGGTEPKDWYLSLQTLFPVYEPQYVFAIFFLRDGTKICTSLRCHKQKIKAISAQYGNAIWYRYTNIGKFVANKLVESEFSDYYQDLIIRSYLGSASERREWIEQRAYIKAIRSFCETNDIQFHLVVFPILHGLESDYQFLGVEEEIVGFADREGMPVFSLTPGFIGRDTRELWVSPSDQHPNEKGHQIAADTLYPYLKDVVLD